MNGSAQVYEFKDPRGWLFVVIASDKTEEEIDGLTSGRKLAGTFHDEYFGHPGVAPFDALRNATQKVVGVEIAACVFVNGIVYSSSSGGSKVIIYRNKSLATILETKIEEAGVIVASGYPKEGDFILFATKAFFEKIGSEDIKTAFANGNPGFAAETFTALTHTGIENSTVGAVILKFENSENAFKVSGPIKKEVELVKKPISVSQKISGLIERIGKKLPPRNIYIKPGLRDEVSSQSKKMTFSIGLILLVILIVSIGFGVRQKKINDLKNKYQGMLQIAQDDVDQAISLSSVSPEKSRELFMDSEVKLQEILNLKIKDQKVTDLQNKIEESRGAILGEHDGTPSLFLDLSLLSSGFIGDVLSASNGQIFILDKSGQRIVGVALDTKKSKVVAGPDVLGSAISVASYQNTVFALASDGIYEVGTTRTKVIDKTWAGEAFISSFAGNMYVLDKSGNTIYRYIGQSDNTFGTQQNWLSASTKPNFSAAVAWGMDGAIYILYPNAKVLKYSLGSPQNFSIFGVVPQIGNIDAIYADPDNQYIYLLDRAGKRVVVIDKKGNYKAQYISDQISGAKSLVVSEAQKEIILLTGDKLLSIQIKN